MKSLIDSQNFLHSVRYMATAWCFAGLILGTPVLSQSSGTLDLSFNSTGYAWADLVWEDHVEDIVVTSTGIIYVAGYTTNSLFTQAYVASFLEDGSLNQTFSLTGKKIFHFGNGEFSRAHDLCVQADGKILIVGEHAASDASASIRSVGLARLNPDGTFDQDFYQDGTRTYHVNQDQAEDSWGTKIKLGSDGMFYVLGVYGGSTNNYAVIAKFFADGTNNLSFGSDGYTTLWFPITFSNHIYGALDFVIQPDEKLVSLSWSLCAEINCPGSSYRLKRNYPNGSPDSSFGYSSPPYGIGAQGETIEWNMGVGGLSAQTDGKLIMAGRTKGLNGLSLGFVARITNDGQMDSTFGNGGKVYIPAPANGNLVFSDVQVQPDGKILCVGTATNMSISSNRVFVQRLLENGNWDSSFGLNGSMLFSLPPHTNIGASAMALQPDNKLLICGTAEGPSDEEDSFVARIHLGPYQVGLNEIAAISSQLSVLPNPLTSESMIQLTLDSPAKITLEIFDTQGRLVQMPIQNKLLQAGTSSLPLDIQGLAPGNYLFSVTSGTKRMSIQVTK